MPELNKIYIFRMTHIDNISHMIRYGITHRSSQNANKEFVSIGDTSLISTRNSFHLNNGRCIGDYIPFYFGRRTPMLYVIQNGYNSASHTAPEDIVYCASSVQQIIDLGLDFVFTDGHAVDRLTEQYSKSDVAKIIKVLDWKAIHAKYWKDDDDLDKKRRKEAEFLVLGDIPYEGVLGFIVYNEDAKEKLVDYGVERERVVIKREDYF